MRKILFRRLVDLGQIADIRAKDFYVQMAIKLGAMLEGKVNLLLYPLFNLLNGKFTAELLCDPILGWSWLLQGIFDVTYPLHVLTAFNLLNIKMIMETDKLNVIGVWVRLC